MAVTAEFPRELAWATPGGFMSYGAQGDLDAAFDEATLADQFDLGSLGLLPSLSGCDPNAVEQRTDVLHPHLALRAALRELPAMAPGQLVAQPVRALKDFQHARARTVVVDPELALPQEPGYLWHYDPVLESAAALADIAEGHTVVSGEMSRVGTRKYQAKAQSIPGPKVTTHGLFDAQGHLLAEYATASEARREALTRARDKSAPVGTWQVRPVLRKADGQPYILVTRTLVACKIPVVVHTAAEKDPRKVTLHGYLFYGRQDTAQEVE